MSQLTDPSVHDSTNAMLERAAAHGVSTTFDRYRAQQPQCGYGMQGVCCQLCSHGPCRITGHASRGICGADADTIVARNLLRLATHGAAAYSHHLEELARTLRAAARGETPFALADEGKLRQVAAALGLEADGPAAAVAEALAQAVMDDLRRESDEPLAFLEAFAPASRKAVWARLGILPGGVRAEVQDALTKSMTSIMTDPVSLLLTTLRLSVAAGYLGLVGTVTVQDILLGTPTPVRSRADLGVLDPGTVNIVAHGHVPLMGTAVLQAAADPDLLARARAAGAEGIKVYGSMCSGQELLQRSAGTARGFAGQTGNWINQELLVATGAVDLMLLDMNCTIPGLKEAADRFHTRLVSVNRMVRLPGVSEAVDFVPQRSGEQARQLVEMAIEAFGRRRGEVFIPEHQAEVLGGFSVEAVSAALGGSLEPLVEAIKSGAVRGVVAVVGCTNNRNGHDHAAVTLTRELIRRDILVLNSGCVSSATQIEGLMDPAAAALAGPGLRAVCEGLGIPPALSFGSCVDIGRIGVAVTALAAAFGVDPSELPVVASAPEYLEQKAVIDGVFAVAFGLTTHLGPMPPVLGSELVTRILTRDVEELTGGRFLPEPDPYKAADLIQGVIDEKRRRLGLRVAEDDLTDAAG